MIDIRLLSDRSQHRRYTPGQRISALENSIEMYVVITGKVDMYAVTLMNKLAAGGSLGPGESFGEIAFFTGINRMVFKAATETTVFVISDKNFEMVCKSQPKIMYSLLQRAYGGTGSEDIKTILRTMMDAANAKKEEAEALEREQAAKQAAEEAKAKSEAPEQAAAEVAPVMSSLFPKGHKSYPGVTKPDYGKLVYDMEYTCPNCGKKFKGKRVFASKLVPMGNQRYDLRIDYRDFNLSWYEIITCPECYFSLFEECFTESKVLYKDKIKDALAVAKSQLNLDFEGERTLDFVFAGYYIALVCALGYTNYRQMNMRIWANLSWLYEDMGDEEMMKYAALKSADASESVYLETKITKPQEQMVCLSTAGMLYRAGATKGLMKWLFNAKVIKNGKQSYVLLAEDLMEKVREETAQQAKA